MGRVTKSMMATRIQRLERAIDKLAASHADLVNYVEGKNSSVDLDWSKEIEENARAARSDVC